MATPSTPSAGQMSSLKSIDELREYRSRGPVFEIRIYSFNIKGMSQYMKMMDRRFWELRTSFSAVLGPWRTELNGLCEIVHIAQYDSLSHLLATRKKMAVNAEWNREVMCIADIQMTFNNFLTVLAPNTELKADFDPLETAVYELQTRPEEEEGEDEQYTGPEATVVGRFLTVYGPSKTEYRLLRYPNPDSAFNCALSDRKGLPRGSSTRLMLPLHVSNMK